VFSRQLKYTVIEPFPLISASKSLKAKLYTRLASSKGISFDPAVEVTSPDEADVVLMAEPNGSRLEWPRLCCKGDLLTDDDAFTAKLKDIVTFHAGLMLKNPAHPLPHAVSVEFQLEGSPSILPSQRRDRSRTSKESSSTPAVDVVQLGGLERVKLVIQNQAHFTLYLHIAFLDIAATRIIPLCATDAPQSRVVLPGSSLDLRRSDDELGGRRLAEVLQPGRTYILKVFLSTRPFDGRWLAQPSDQWSVSSDVPQIAISGIWDTVEQRIHIAEPSPPSALPGGTDRKADLSVRTLAESDKEPPRPGHQMLSESPTLSPTRTSPSILADANLGSDDLGERPTPLQQLVAGCHSDVAAQRLDLVPAFHERHGLSHLMSRALAASKIVELLHHIPPAEVVQSIHPLLSKLAGDEGHLPI
jgi:hypothetical protein